MSDCGDTCNIQQFNKKINTITNSDSEAVINDCVYFSKNYNEYRDHNTSSDDDNSVDSYTSYSSSSSSRGHRKINKKYHRYHCEEDDDEYVGNVFNKFKIDDDNNVCKTVRKPHKKPCNNTKFQFDDDVVKSKVYNSQSDKSKFYFDETPKFTFNTKPIKPVKPVKKKCEDKYPICHKCHKPKRVRRRKHRLDECEILNHHNRRSNRIQEMYDEF